MIQFEVASFVIIIILFLQQTVLIQICMDGQRNFCCITEGEKARRKAMKIAVGLPGNKATFSKFTTLQTPLLNLVIIVVLVLKNCFPLMMLENQQWATRYTGDRDDTCTTQKRKDLTESTGVVLVEYPPNVKLELLTTLESKRRVNYAYLDWWGYWGFYSSRAWTSPSRIKSLFLLGISLKHTLRDPFLMGIPLDSAKRGEQVISLYTRYVGGKQILISTVGL